MTVEECIVAFVDIVAFRRLIRKAQCDTSVYELVHRALSDVMQVDPKVSRIGSVIGSDPSTVTAFSDCTVISRPADYIGPMRVMFDACRLATRLLKNGVFCRGGIAKGPLHHGEGVVFGWGMIKAYELESKCAIYPRIVIEDEIAEDVAKQCGGVEYAPAPIERGEDGLWHINVFRRFAEDATEKEHRVAAAAIDDHLTDSEQYDHRAKWQWAGIQLDKALEESRNT